MTIFRKLFTTLTLSCMVGTTIAQQHTEHDHQSIGAYDDPDMLLVGGKIYSALAHVSPESGDLVLYYFKNQSSVGRKILSNCVPEMFCKTSGEKMRDISSENPPGDINFDLANSASSTFELTSVANAELASSHDTYESSMSTRFGEISVDEENMLRFKGRRVQPKVQGDSSLSLKDIFEQIRQDVVLVQNTGGTACPALFQFVFVNAGGVQVSPEFGTCSDYFRVYQRDDGGIVFHTVQADDSGKGKHSRLRRVDYLFHKGVLTENGKVVKP